MVLKAGQFFGLSLIAGVSEIKRLEILGNSIVQEHLLVQVTCIVYVDMVLPVPNGEKLCLIDIRSAYWSFEHAGCGDMGV